LILSVDALLFEFRIPLPLCGCIGFRLRCGRCSCSIIVV
jgi:hypothetical protein